MIHLESPPPLYVVSAYFDPLDTPYRKPLFERFTAWISRFPVILIVVELAYGNRPFQVTQNGNPHHVQLRAGSGSEFFIKGALINRGFVRVGELDRSWSQGCWFDGDIQFLRSDWVEQIQKELDRYKVLQPWSNAIDLGPNWEVVTNEWGHDVDKSFGAAFQDGDGMFQDPNLPQEAYGRGDWRAHAGFAWAGRRETLDAIGGMIDWMPTGNEDFMMAMGFSGKLRAFVAKEEADKKRKFTAGYKQKLLAFADLCDRYVNLDLGYVPGTVVHWWHGRKTDRGYLTRVKINDDSFFDPQLHLVYDHQRLPMIRENQTTLRAHLRRWLRSRNEGATEVEPRNLQYRNRHSPRY
jgi:hypothetical protein